MRVVTTAPRPRTAATSETTGERGDRAGRWWRRRGRLGPFLYVAPALGALLVWVYVPAVFTVLLSFLHWNLTGDDRPFAGLDNYTRLVTEPEFPSATFRTLLYIAGLLPFATVLPMAMAILLWKHPGRGGATHRALLFTPVVLAPVATAVSWRFILDPLQGVLNAVLGTEVNWLGSAGTALWVIVVISGVKIFALNVLLYLAGLAAVDRRYVDAARIDGASEWQVTRYLLIPLLSRTTWLVGFLCLVLAGQWAFVNVGVLTQGGPQGSTDNVYYRLYDYGFSFFDTGLASAAAVSIMAVLGLLAALQAWLGRKEHVHED